MLRIGILSTGNIARQFAAGLTAARRCRAVAVGSRNLDAAKTFATQFSLPRAFGSYQHLIDDPQIDAIYNALPNTLHHHWTIAALRAGKHVLCEKPIAANSTEAIEMFEVARQTGRVLMEAFMYRSHPQTLAVIDAVRSGAIGKIRIIRSSFCFRTNKVQGNIRFDPALAGGALMDIGCYCINFSRLFANAEPIAMHATGHRHELGIEDAAAGMLKFRDGTVASFTCGLSMHADNTAYLLGEEGFIEIPVPWKPIMQSQFTIARGIPPRMDNPAAVAGPPREVRQITAPAELYAIEADDFAAAVLDKTPPRISADDTIGNMRVLDELRRQVLQ